jgi:predicted Zn-dependent protease with MMP-like domain
MRIRELPKTAAACDSNRKLNRRTPNDPLIPANLPHMSPRERNHFDRLLEEVIESLPPMVTDLIGDVPIIVEDFPSAELRRELNLSQFDDLCGLFHGIAKTDPEREPGRVHSDQVYLFREGIMSEAANEAGIVIDEELKRQIRITILHEYGHHFGLDEDDLSELGYE